MRLQSVSVRKEGRGFSDDIQYGGVSNTGNGGMRILEQ
jgi:hypothetical protein